MKVLNNTHYFNEFSRLYNTFPDYNSFESQSQRRMGYFQRLYFEYLYTQKVKGSCFFYTLTYNNKSIPHFLGLPCFCYKDIRYVTNGSLSKNLNRNYGSRLRYFCACERGDGKGKRGLGNNPHYHFIFYVQPLHDNDGNPLFDGYHAISPVEFKSLILQLWQGSSKFIPFQSCKFGIAKEGLNLGLVTSTEAFSYVAKYVTKDSVECQNESIILQQYSLSCLNRVINSPSHIKQFYIHCKAIYPDFDRSQFIGMLGLLHYQRLRKLNSRLTFSEFLSQYSNYYGLSSDFIIELYKFMRETFVVDYAHQKLLEYRSTYGSKPRLSKSLGIYGLQFVTDVPNNPRFIVPTNNGYKVQYPCQYYIRKLYYDVVKCPYTGNPLYVLSDLGRTFKCNQLLPKINKLITSTKENLSYVYLNKVCLQNPKNKEDKLFCHILDNVVNKTHSVDVIPSFSTSSMTKEIDILTSRHDYEHILWCYSVYKNVYEYRSYVTFDTQLDDRCLFEHVISDYKLFLKHDFYYFDYDSSSILILLDTLHSVDKLKSFRNLPVFSRYIEWFFLLDSVNEQVCSILSENKKVVYNERSEHQKKLNQYKYECSI